MSLYEILVAVHIVGAICWVGSNTTLHISSVRILGRNQPDEIQGFVSDIVWLSPRWFIPVSLLTVVFGAAAVVEGPWSFGDPWVSAGLTMFVISFLIGLLYMKPASEKIEVIGQSEGPDSAPFRELLGKMLTAGRIELVLLWVTVLLMTFKPG